MTTNLPAPTAPSTPSPVANWRSTLGLRTALTWLVALEAVATATCTIARYHREEVVDRYNAGRTSFQAAKRADDALGYVALFVLAILVANAVVLINWMWRSAHNNEQLRRIRTRYSPGWSIGGWFIPFLNLVIPVRVMQDLWQGSDPEVGGYSDWRRLRRSPLVGWWWGCYLAGAVFAFTFGGTAFTIAAAVLLIVLVRRITRRQEIARTSRRGISPAWYADPLHRFDHRYWNGSSWTVHVARLGELAVDPLV